MTDKLYKKLKTQHWQVYCYGCKLQFACCTEREAHTNPLVGKPAGGLKTQHWQVYCYGCKLQFACCAEREARSAFKATGG